MQRETERELNQTAGKLAKNKAIKKGKKGDPQRALRRH